ncbi:MAG: 30S ribosomal protein S20 [Deltaproteobacteria bacterium]|nr:30S ribosomal protein S20 [Deltaproteobacteria bacterium]
MANHKSALKRARQSVVRHARNSINKTKVKNTVKKALSTIGGPQEESALALKKAMSMLHKAASKGTLHPRNAARRISRLSQHIFKGQTES